MNTRYFNQDLDGSDIPLSVGDRYYGQDRVRDTYNAREYGALIANSILNREGNTIINGANVTQGAGHTINITLGRAVVNFERKLPSDWSVLPPVMSNTTFPIVVEIPALTNQSISGATTDNITTNYVKISYAENFVQTRARAKKTGSYSSETESSYTLTVDAVAPTTFEVTLATFVTNGTTITFLAPESRGILQTTPTAEITVDTTITDTDVTEIFDLQPNTASQYGILKLTMPVGANNADKLFTITHGSNQGLCQIVFQGGNVLRYRNQDLTYFNLYQQGDKIVIFWSASAGKWFIYSCNVTYQTGFINRNVWANTYFGSAQIDYTTKSVTKDLTGMVMQESISGNTWVVASDSAPGATSGILYCYLATGTGWATNGRTLTALGDGTTCVVSTVGSTKNQNVNISHYSGISFEHARFYQLFTATPGTEASYRQLGPQWTNSTDQYNYGYSPVDLNFYRTVLTGGAAFAYADPGGSPVGIVAITGEFYYNLYVQYIV